MRIASPGHVVFAAIMMALGVMGFVQGDFAPIFASAPRDIPGREALAYVCAFVSLACGAGLLVRPTAAFAARLLFVFLLLWLLLIKAPFILRDPLVEVSYQSAGETAVLVAAAWVLYAWFAPDWENRRLGAVTGDNGVRLARGLYALAMIAFGLSHFFYLDMTAPLVPHWLGWPVGWAYFTGGAYLAAGLALLTGVCARSAAVLSVLQMGLITVLVWAPIVTAADVSNRHWIEFIVSSALTAGGWVVADSYRGAPWFALTGQSRNIAA